MTQQPKATVLLILPALVMAGAERVVANLAYRLPKRGYAVQVISLQDANSTLGNELRQSLTDEHLQMA